MTVAPPRSPKQYSTKNSYKQALESNVAIGNLNIFTVSLR